MARLRQDAERLLISFAAWDTLQAEMEQAAQGCEQGVVKTILTRGSGGRGYSPLSCSEPTRIVMQAAYPAHLHITLNGVRRALLLASALLP